MPSEWPDVLINSTQTKMPSDRYGFGNRQAALGSYSGFSGGGSSLIAPGSGTLPYADLASQLNTFMAGQAQVPFMANLPGYGANLAQQSGNTGSMLRGEVPLDVLNQIQQAGAERGISTGSPGSSNANAAWLRALGLTSLGLQGQGSQQFSQQIADTPVPEIWNPASLFVPQTLAREELSAAQSGLSSGAGGGWKAPNTPADGMYSNLYGGWNRI